MSGAELFAQSNPQNCSANGAHVPRGVTGEVRTAGTPLHARHTAAEGVLHTRTFRAGDVTSRHAPGPSSGCEPGRQESTNGLLTAFIILRYLQRNVTRNLRHPRGPPYFQLRPLDPRYAGRPCRPPRRPRPPPYTRGEKMAPGAGPHERPPTAGRSTERSEAAPRGRRGPHRVPTQTQPRPLSARARDWP